LWPIKATAECVPVTDQHLPDHGKRAAHEKRGGQDQTQGEQPFRREPPRGGVDV